MFWAALANEMSIQRIKKDSRSDYGVQTIKKLKKTKSGQRLDDKKR